MREVSLYHIIGVPGEYYTTKIAAEQRARSVFPDEDPDNRYSRIYVKTVYATADSGWPANC